MTRLPLEIRFRHMTPSPALEANIRERAEKLEDFCDQLMRCRVLVEVPHKHRSQGRLFRATVYLTVPGREIVASRGSDDDPRHEDPYAAVHDAFDEVRRELQDYVRQRRGQVKSHEVPLHGIVAEIYPEMGYGKIRSSDDRLIYFHRNSVVDGSFDRLEIGAAVRFSEEMGDLGPQATSVHVIGKHHVVSYA